MSLDSKISVVIPLSCEFTNLKKLLKENYSLERTLGEKESQMNTSRYNHRIDL